MTPGEIRLISVAILGIVLAIWMIAKLRFHPFIGLITAAFLIGIFSGSPPEAVILSVEKGFGDILKGTGLVVALGLGLGAVLQLSGGAKALAVSALNALGPNRITLGAVLAAFLLGLPLFFETGVVLLLPIIAAGFAATGADDGKRLRVMLSALAGLSVMHALLPPHPGPLIALKELNAPLVRTMALGLIAAIPTVLIAGPLLARYTTRGVRVEDPGMSAAQAIGESSWQRGLIVLLFPVLLIATGAFASLGGAMSPEAAGWISFLSDPAVAMLLALMLGFALLFGKRMTEAEVQNRVWAEAMLPAAGILLSIGAGGSLKQVLVDGGLSDIFVKLAAQDMMPPLVLAWLVAVAVRVATGSATVATITTAGVMGGVAAGGQVDPALMVLAIGAGSVFLSHVNDPGFWLVKGYLGTSTAHTFRTWSVLETAISVVGLLTVLILQFLISSFAR